MYNYIFIRMCICILLCCCTRIGISICAQLSGKNLTCLQDKALTLVQQCLLCVEKCLSRLQTRRLVCEVPTFVLQHARNLDTNHSMHDHAVRSNKTYTHNGS